MPDEPTPTEDTSTTAPQEPAVEIVDTPQGEPEGGTTATAPTEPQTQELIFGKYSSMEEAEKAYREAEQKMHDASKEASIYRDQIESSRSTPPQYPAQPNTEEINERFRQSLESQPFETLVALADQRAEEKFRAYTEAKEREQQETFRRFRDFSDKDGYRDVADSVAKNLPFSEPADAVEASFLRERVRMLEERVKKGAGAGSTASALNQRRTFVEPGTGSGTADITRIEVDGDAKKFRSIFPGMNDEQYRKLVIDAARNKATREARLSRSMSSALSQAHDERTIADYEVKK
jgi:hypothetical protein